MSVLDLPHLLPTILELQYGCVVGRNGYGSHGASACRVWVVWVLLNVCGGWVVSPIIEIDVDGQLVAKPFIPKPREFPHLHLIHTLSSL